MYASTLLVAATAFASANAWYVLGNSAVRGTGSGTFSNNNQSGNSSCLAIAATPATRSLAFIFQSADIGSVKPTLFGYTDTACASGEESVLIYDQTTGILSGTTAYRSYRVVANQ